MSAKFKDLAGQEWDLRIKLGDLPKLMAAGIDLDKVAAEPAGLIGVMGLGPRAMGEALWMLCEKQADARGVSPDQFADELDGDALEQARRSLAEACLLFFRPPGTTQMLASLADLLEAADRETGKEIKRRVDDLKSSGGNSPEKSESIPPS